MGGTSSILVALGASLPNGLGPATSYTAFGAPDLIGGVVYFGGQSASGSGYYSVPVAGGAIHVIVDSTSEDASGRTIGALALPQDVGSTPDSYDLSPLPIPGIESNLFISPLGGATFAANLTSAAAPQGDTAILNLSPSGVLSTVVDQSNLSGCTELTNFATDGTIFAVWTVSTSGHVLLLENNGPSLSCSNVLLDLGVPGTDAANILPGQPASGSILDRFVAPSTVIDSGYIYFSATMSLTDPTINLGSYSGIFRIKPGGSLEKVIATDNSALGTTGSVNTAYNFPLYLCSSFAVHGDYIVFASAWVDHHGLGTNPLFPIALFFLNQTTGTLRPIYKLNDSLAPNTVVAVDDGNGVTQAGLTADGKLAFETAVQSVVPFSSGTAYNALYTVNLLSAGTATTLSVSPTSATYGTTETLTATVISTGSSPLNGSVSFQDGSTVIGTAPVNASGAATLMRILGGGSNSLTATYGGDPANGPSTGSATLLVSLATPVIKVSSSAPSITAAGSVTFTATAVGATGAAVPTGSIAFVDGSANLGTSSLNSAGIATLTVQSLPVGANSTTAAYGGDSNYSSITSAAMTVNVSAVSTSTVLTTSLTTAPVGTAVTLTALVAVSQGTPSGTVNFLSNGAAIGSAAVDSSGAAILVVNSLPVGTDSIQASFAGNIFYPASMSSVVTVAITAPPTFSVSSSSSTLTIPQGESGTLTISLTPSAGFSSAVQFSCSGLPQYATCSFAPQSVTPGASGATTSMTIATDVQTSQLSFASGLAYAGLLLLGLSGTCRFRARSFRIPLSMVFLAAAVHATLGCGGGNATPSNVTPAGVSKVTVQAASGTNVQTLAVTVTISQN